MCWRRTPEVSAAIRDVIECTIHSSTAMWLSNGVRPLQSGLTTSVAGLA
jgi:hypothetical protein